ncbi:hypothetical protein LCGC14_1738750 [marine sediment metagenome]|uniref:DUF1937 domain-containing protein n=1 Tax=marine sediment metagenome TaxID=412755 RepID=A0A0F9K704_9ZZZZ
MQTKMSLESSKKLYYLAHPYTPDENMTEMRNVVECINIANDLLDKGFHIYAPIIMTHWLHNKKNREYDFWVNEDRIIMERCNGIILSGKWDKSEGCVKEKEFFEEQYKEVLYYDEIINQV